MAGPNKNKTQGQAKGLQPMAKKQIRPANLQESAKKLRTTPQIMIRHYNLKQFDYAKQINDPYILQVY